MTEAAIDSGGAAAPAVPVDAVLTADTATHNNPIQATMPEKEPLKVEKPVSASDAIKAAQDTVAAKEAEAKAKVEPEKAKVEPAKDAKTDTGTAEAAAKARNVPAPVADNGQSEGRVSRYEAPARFNDQGKTDWASTPESVQAEVHRAIKNLEDGFTKHKEPAERYEKFRPFDEIAKTNGRDLTESIAKVIEFEKVMGQNPFAAINFVLRESGPRGPDGKPFTIDDIVAHVSGQSGDERLAAANGRIRELEAQIEARETEARIPKMVEEFASSHPRFEELKPVMIPLIKAGHNMDTAYELADALKPASSASSATTVQTTQASPAAEIASPAPARPNPAGQKSISGAPSSGSTSGGKKRVLTSSEALKAAMARA